MKRLVLLRHFKSSWPEPGIPDYDRPLAPRGQRDAIAMAEAMVSHDLVPERILCSPARRTRETLAALAPGLGDGRDITFIDALYAGHDEDYREIIAAEGGDVDRLMVIGHNPRIHATALALIGSGSRTQRNHLAAKYPTGSLTALEFEARSWAALEEGSGALVAFIRPHDLTPEV